MQQYQKAADDYIELLSTLKKEQGNLDAKMDDVIHKKFALELTKTLMGGFSSEKCSARTNFNSALMHVSLRVGIRTASKKLQIICLKLMNWHMRG